MVGGQAVQAVTPAQPGRTPRFPVRRPHVKEGWWARLRKRGAIVAFATIIGGVAGSPELSSRY